MEELKVVIILGNPFEKEHEIHQKIKPAQLIVHIGTYQNCWSEIADVVLPGQYYSEKRAHLPTNSSRYSYRYFYSGFAKKSP